MTCGARSMFSFLCCYWWGCCDVHCRAEHLPAPPGVPGFPGFFLGRSDFDFCQLLVSNPKSDKIEVRIVVLKPREPREPRGLGLGPARCWSLPDDPVDGLLEGPVGALWMQLQVTGPAAGMVAAPVPERLPETGVAALGAGDAIPNRRQGTRQ